MGIKDQIAADLEIFFNLDEFAEMHNINGRQLPAIVESAATRVRSNRKSENYDGIYGGEVVVYVRAADFPAVPSYGQTFRLDGKLYYVAECTNEGGVLEIVLGANES